MFASIATAISGIFLALGSVFGAPTIPAQPAPVRASPIAHAGAIITPEPTALWHSAQGVSPSDTHAFAGSAASVLTPAMWGAATPRVGLGAANYSSGRANFIASLTLCSDLLGK